MEFNNTRSLCPWKSDQNCMVGVVGWWGQGMKRSRGGGGRAWRGLGVVDVLRGLKGVQCVGGQGVVVGQWVWGYVKYSLSILLENVKWWLLMSKVTRIGTPNYAMRPWVPLMAYTPYVTQWIPPESLSKCEKSNFESEMRGYCLHDPH